ncbi:hypothetical protein [Pontibacter sp. G13]|uniref:hypothetical protein n=1 Tax=Pontibacter sp. G13 TaxID=3074898 RepID=UPI00288B0BDF|nr:hypothetical protein [Pontibacter sp. G13]WNJ21120.1 hypothetical protein RJD25_11680 [Pontibacter sp. G13]
MRPILTILLFLCTISWGWSQNYGPPMQIGLGLSGITYAGDLAALDDPIKRISAGFNLSFEKDHNRVWRTRLNLGLGSFSEQSDRIGAKVSISPDGESFVRTQFYFGDLTLLAHPLPNKRIQPFLGLGAGILLFYPKDAQGTPLHVDELQNRLFNTAVPQIPGTIGVKGELTPMVSLSMGYTYRFIPTDLLDSTEVESGFDAVHTLTLRLLITMISPRRAIQK